MFSKVKMHWVFVNSWIKGMRLKILTNELEHIKVTENIALQCF